MRLEWDRRIALPLYQYINTDEVPSWEPQSPDDHGNAFCGRVVIWGRARSEPQAPHTQQVPMPDESVRNLGPQDIVFAPLFNGQDPTRATSVQDRLPPAIYERNMDHLRAFAPRVKAVILGNAGPETAFGEYPGKIVMLPRDKWKRKKHRASDPQARINCNPKHWVYGPEVLGRHLEFLKDCAQITTETGGRLAYAPNAMEFAMDLYMTGGALRRAMLAVNALLVQFLGFVEWQKDDRPHLWRSPYGGKFNPLLAGYLQGIEAVSGMEFKAGLRAGNDIKAREHGYSAGLIGWS